MPKRKSEDYTIRELRTLCAERELSPRGTVDVLRARLGLPTIGDPSEDKVTHCSTGSGASSELLEGKAFPGSGTVADAEDQITHCSTGGGALLQVLEGKALDAGEEVLEPPVLAILGGAKVSDKIQRIMNMLDKVDKIIVGGGVAYTFLKVHDGMAIGTSLYDEEGAKIVPEIMEKAKKLGVEILLPVDFTISSEFGEDGDIKEATKEAGIPDDFMGLDCGPKSIEMNKAAVDASKTIFWNGPMGVFEMPKFEIGTKALVDAVVAATAAGTETMIVGENTAIACKKYDTEDKVVFSDA